VLTTIVITPAAFSMLIGATQQLTAVGYDQNGAAMRGIVFAWSSSKQSVASVSSAGLAAGVAAGTAQITASA